MCLTNIYQVCTVFCGWNIFSITPDTNIVIKVQQLAGNESCDMLAMNCCVIDVFVVTVLDLSVVRFVSVEVAVAVTLECTAVPPSNTNAGR